MKQTSLRIFATLSLGFLLPMNSGHADLLVHSIGFNFASIENGDGVNRANGGIWDDLSGFGPSISAGAPGYAQTNWNHFRGDWGGTADNDTTHANLLNSTGASVTNLDPHWNMAPDRTRFDAANTWTSGIGNANPNATLMNGYLDDGGDNQPYVNLDLKYNGEAGADGIDYYDVIVYVHGDGTGNTGRYWVEDPFGAVLTDQIGITANDYTGTFNLAGTFAQTATPQDVNVPTGNYIVFSGITADTISVRAAGLGDPEVYGRGPLNAVQFVAMSIPEPSSMMLAGLGAALVFFCRRRS